MSGATANWAITAAEISKLIYAKTPPKDTVLAKRFFISNIGAPHPLFTYINPNDPGKKTYILPACARQLTRYALRDFSGEDGFPETNPPTNFKVLEGLWILPASAMFPIWQLFVENGLTCKIEASREVDINHIIAPLIQIDGMKAAITDYFSRKDPGISILELCATAELENIGAGIMKYETFCLKPPFSTRDNEAWSIPEMEFMAFMIILAMYKNITDEGQLAKVVKNRANGFCNSMGYRVLNSVQLNRMFNRDFIVKVHETMAILPELKSTIAIHVLRDIGPFSDYVRTILKDAQLTVFNMMVNFVFATDMRAIHLQTNVLSETLNFIQVFEALRAKYSDAWPYVKVIDPLDQTTAHSKFKHLASASFAYVVTNSPDVENLSYINIANGFSRKYAKMCAEEIPSTLRKENRAAIFTELRARYQAAGIEFPYLDGIESYIPKGDITQAELDHIDNFIGYIQRRKQMN